MTKKLTKRQLQAQKTRKNLYESAVELFKTLPFDEVTVKDICNKADMSIGVFYHYFSSKDDILLEGYRLFDRTLTEFMATNETDEPLENISLVLNKYFEAVNRYGDIYRRFFFRVELANQPEYILDLQRPMDQFLFKYIRKAIEDNLLVGHDYEIYHHLKSVMKGTSYMWALHNGDFDIPEVGTKRCDMILSYFKPDE